MDVRDLNIPQTPILWGAAVDPIKTGQTSPRLESLGEEAQKLKLEALCGELRSDRNFLLGFSTAFLATSAMMAKALHDHSPYVPETRKDFYQTASKIIAIAPTLIAGAFLQAAYRSNKTYYECLQDPQGTLAKIAAKEEKPDDTRKRNSLNISEVLGPVSWLAGAGALAKTIAYYGATLAEGAVSASLILCSPGLRYFEASQRETTLL